MKVEPPSQCVDHLVDEQGKTDSVHPGPNGEFSLAGLLAGTYHLTVTATDFEHLDRRP